MTAAVALGAGVLGCLLGVLVNRAAGAFPWETARIRDALTGRARAVRPPLLEVGAGALCVLVALRFGPSPELPAFLFLAVAGLLLAVIDLQHRLLPNRVVFPSVAVGAVLLTAAAAVEATWPALLRAGVGAAVLFAVFLFLALVSPSGLGMGDVKLAALLGLYLGWLGWGVLVVGAASGFVVQAVVAVALLAVRRIGLRGELPFGPAMLVGAALAIGWSDALLG
jgi:leader peptidase (prepilin peptidase)/N-methyltransferase